MTSNIIKKIRDFIYMKFFHVNFAKTVARARQVAEEYGDEAGFSRGFKEGFDVGRSDLDKEKQASLYINIDEVFTEKDGKRYLGNRKLTDQELENLLAEAKAIHSFTFWHLVQETIKQKAIEKSVLHSTEWEHVLAGKMMLYNLNIQKEIFKSLLAIKVAKK